jgi:lysophospholipase L1-like esterase
MGEGRAPSRRPPEQEHDMATEHPPLALAVDVIMPRDVGHGESQEQPDNPDYGWHVLAEGDSWFTIAAIPSSNLLLELRLGRWTQILNLAYPGDTLRGIEKLARNKDLKRFLAKKNFCSHFDALLLSGGGNDLIDGVGALIRTTPAAGADPSSPASYIDGEAFAALLQKVQDAFATIVALRDSQHSLSRNSPAFVHTYDYATPRNAPARFVGALPIAGPWLFKAFAGSGIEIALQQRIADLLTDGLADALLQLDAETGSEGRKLPAFHVVDTRDTLVRANPTEHGNSNDWLNEIHPNLAGYRKIAARLTARINAVLGS